MMAQRDVEESGANGRESPPKNYAAQAGILCGDPVFQAYLRDVTGREVVDKDEAAAALREMAGVASRREFNGAGKGAEAWRRVLVGFGHWQSGVGFKGDPDRFDPLRMGRLAHARGTAEDRNPFDSRDDACHRWHRGWSAARKAALTDVQEFEGALV